MRVWLNVQALQVFNLSASDIYQDLATNNTIATIGYGENSRQKINIVTTTHLSSVELANHAQELGANKLAAATEAAKR